jgi:hypothetical protein
MTYTPKPNLDDIIQKSNIFGDFHSFFYSKPKNVEVTTIGGATANFGQDGLKLSAGTTAEDYVIVETPKYDASGLNTRNFPDVKRIILLDIDTSRTNPDELTDKAIFGGIWRPNSNIGNFSNPDGWGGIAYQQQFIFAGTNNSDIDPLPANFGTVDSGIRLILVADEEMNETTIWTYYGSNLYKTAINDVWYPKRSAAIIKSEGGGDIFRLRQVQSAVVAPTPL